MKRLVKLLSVLINKAKALKYVGQAMDSLAYWTGWHKTDMKPSEWVVVVIGVVAGVLILQLSSSSAPISATLAPMPRPTPVSNNLETKAGQEWDCLIVDENLNQLNLVCEKDSEESPILVQVEPVNAQP